LFPVPHVGQLQLLERAAFVLEDREEVPDDLAWMFLVVEAVDHRDGCTPSQFLDVLSLERAVHDAIHIAAQDLRGVGDRLAAANLQVVRAEEERMAAELRHPDLERDPRPSRGLLENHREALPAQRFVRLPGLRAILDARRELEEADQVVLDIEDRDEIALRAHGPAAHPRVRTKHLCIDRGGGGAIK